VPGRLTGALTVPLPVVAGRLAVDPGTPVAPVTPGTPVDPGTAAPGAVALAGEAEVEAAGVAGWVRSAGAVAGLNVATESMAPATRQMARMLASSGMIVPRPASGPPSRRRRPRRRLARSSRW
jgi:hypothetical protein